ncbi:hypothetical protein GCM10008992_10150 [Halorubrum aquaticum]
MIEIGSKSLDLALSKFKLYNLYIDKNIIEQKRYVDRLTNSGFGIPLYNKNIQTHKSSDELFILGSGSSINDISQDQWEYIGSQDSIGLNRWPLHDFTPTYYVFEVPSKDLGVQMRIDFWNLLNHKRDEYSSIPIILKDIRRFHNTNLNKHPDWLSKSILLSPDIVLPPVLSNSRKEFRSVLQYINQTGYFSNNSSMEYLFKKVGSISYLIILGCKLGYEKIILCGVDMVNNKYFWDHKRDELKQKDIPIPESSRSNKQEIHSTNDPSVHNITLEEIIYELNEIVLKDKNIDLYTETKVSSLYPRIPHYNTHTN